MFFGFCEADSQLHEFGPGCRVGEAAHPGPDFLQVTTSNPSGLRAKKLTAIEQGTGIHCFSETQLSEISASQSRRIMQGLARPHGRQVRLITGHPAPLRPNSDWAGSWTGVAMLSDWPAQSLCLPWPANTFETGRVQLVQHLLPGFPLLIGNIYGFSQNHARATALTDQLLAPFTQELVLGRTGPRILCGDLNASAPDLEQVRIWESIGWRFRS